MTKHPQSAISSHQINTLNYGQNTCYFRQTEQPIALPIRHTCLLPLLYAHLPTCPCYTVIGYGKRHAQFQYYYYHVHSIGRDDYLACADDGALSPDAPQLVALCGMGSSRTHHHEPIHGAIPHTDV